MTEDLQASELIEKLSDPLWRITSGKLYKIIVKESDSDDDDGGLVMPFIPNRAQRRFLRSLHNRNIILKARQLGFSTLVAIMWLDHALFVPNSSVAIIAQDRDTAEALFRSKVKFGYDNLPDTIKAMIPLVSCTKSEIEFANGSTFRVATSVRGRTLHRLHVSEFGKICAKYPDKAVEVVTGSIPAVPKGGILVIESTAEGRDGEFFHMTQRAIAVKDSGKDLPERDYRFHFFPWFAAPEYEMNPDGVVMTPKDHEYFDQIEAKTGQPISMEKRAWYVSTRDTDFSGDEEKMWQEYPSTPEEAFQKSTAGCYYTTQISQARKQKRICNFPILPSEPCYTFWDIGHSDGTAIWVMQNVGQEDHFIHFIEGWGEPYAHFVLELQKLGLVYAKHFLPHDADHVRQGSTVNQSPKQMLEDLLPGATFEIVPRVQEINWGIQQARDAFPACYFHAENTKEGVIHLESYKKKWNERQACWSDEPLHDIHSEGADAFRQYAQAKAGGLLLRQAAWKRKGGSSWRTA